MYSKALQTVKPDLLTNVRFYDLPNMIGQLTTHLHKYEFQSTMLQDGTYIGKILTECFGRLFILLQSDYFRNLVKTIRGSGYLCRSHNLFSLDRIFVKQNTDLKFGKQINVDQLAALLPFNREDYVVQTDIKKYLRDENHHKYPIFCDIDAEFIHAMVELLYYCKYEKEKNFMEYIIVGSGDKDYSGICKLAKEIGILVISVSFMGEGLSKNMIDFSDIVFILYPKLCIRKPYLYCLEELYNSKSKIPIVESK